MVYESRSPKESSQYSGEQADGKPPVVLIDGATGYVGNHLTAELIGHGMSVRCLVRPQALPADVSFLQSLGAQVFVGELDGGDLTVESAFDGAQVAVHLIGSIAPKKGETFASLHGAQTEAFAYRCKRAQVAKAIMVTALGTSAQAPSAYHQSKWQGEENLKASGVNALFFRPSLIVGRQVGQRDSKLVKRYRDMIIKRARVPLIGGGENKVQPIFVGDLVKAIRLAISNKAAGKGASAPVYNVAGPRAVTMRAFLSELMGSLGIAKPFLNVPIPLAKMAALGAELFQEVPVLSADQVQLAINDNILTENQLEIAFQIDPVDLKEALATYGKNRMSAAEPLAADPSCRN